MKIQISDFIAALALLISLFSLWLQTKGASQQLLVTNISEYTKRYQEIFEKLPASVIDESFELSSIKDEGEKERIIRYIWLYFDLCYEEYLLHYELNLINKKVWKIWESAMVSAFSRPAFRQCWKYIFANSFYPKQFSQFVNKRMNI